MPKSKTLNGVAHNLGHHATSGLCYVIPYLFRACLAAKAFDVTLDLQSPDPLPRELPADRPLALSSQALLDKFHEILQKAGFKSADVAVASLRFRFAPQRPDTLQTRFYLARIGEASYDHDPAYHCTAEICVKSGKSYHHDFHSWHYNEA